MLAEIGHSRPPFALRDQFDRNATPLDDDTIGDPVVLVFDRSSAENHDENSEGLLRCFTGLHNELNGLVAHILIITRDPVPKNRELSDKLNSPLRLLADESGKVFDLYGVDREWRPFTRRLPFSTPMAALLQSAKQSRPKNRWRLF